MQDSRAAEIVDQLPGLTPGERMIVLCVSRLETNYGGGWKAPGVGSHNWGAITAGASWTGPTFAYSDSRRDAGTGQVVKYTTRFRIYPDDLAGAADVARVALKPNVRDAIARRDLRGVSVAMRENSYYLGTAATRDGQIDAHHSRMAECLVSIVANTGRQNPFGAMGVLYPEPSGTGNLYPVPTSVGLGALGLVGLLATGGWWLWSKLRRR